MSGKGEGHTPNNAQATDDNQQSQNQNPTPEPKPNGEGEGGKDDGGIDYKAAYEDMQAQLVELKKHSRSWEKEAKAGRKTISGLNENLSEAQEALARVQQLEEQIEAKDKEIARTALIDEIAEEKGVNRSFLAKYAKADDKEGIEAEADEILELLGNAQPSNSYPKVKDKQGGGKSPTLSKEDIQKIKNPRERRAAIAANMGLFDK